MAVFEIQAPDGKTYEVDGPDNASQAGLQRALVNAGIAKYSDFADRKDPMLDPTGSFWDNAAAGAGKAVTDLYRGAKQTFGIGNQDALAQEIADSRQTDAPLMETGGGKFGNIAGTAAAALPAALLPGGQGYAGAALSGALLGALTPTVGDESWGLNTAAGAAGGVAGQYVGSKLANAAASKLSNVVAGNAQRAAQNADRDATIKAAKAAGYVLQPREANPDSAIASVLEGISGKQQTSAAVGTQNAETTNAIARRALGLPENASLSRATVDARLKQIGKPYEALKQAPDFHVDDQFASELNAIVEKFGGQGRVKSPAYPEIKSQVDSFLGKSEDAVAQVKSALGLPKDAEISPQVAESIAKQFPPQPLKASTTVGDIKQLYANAAHNLRPTNQNPGAKDLGLAQRQIAEAVQNLIDRNLQKTGQSDLLANFRMARPAYATAMSVRRAIKEGSGNVLASQLARQLNNGVPLSGELATAARFANTMPQAVKIPAYKPGFSALDWGAMSGMGGLSALATGNPMGLLAGLAFPVSRNLARAAIMSRPFQASAAMNPGYSVGLLTRAAPGITGALKPVAPTFGAMGLLNSIPGYFPQQ